MVLEEVASSSQPSSSSSSPSSSSFSDHAPAGDFDAYSGDHNPILLSTRDPSYLRVSPRDSPDAVFVNVEQLPRMWSLLGSKPHPRQVLTSIVESCAYNSQVLGRPIRQEEADALAFHITKAFRIASFGPPIGISLAMAQAYRRRKAYRFPGWTPGESWWGKGYPNVFFFLRGRNARVVWHTARFAAYGWSGSYLGRIFFGGYAYTVADTGRQLDPRLKELKDAYEQKAKSSHGSVLLPAEREVDDTAGMRGGETWEMARQRQRVQESFRKGGLARPTNDVDDMSPNGGAFANEYSQTNMDTLSDEQVAASHRNEQREKDPENRWTAISRRAPPERRTTKEASHITSSDSTSRPSGSAWDRLRQQAAAGTQSQRSPKTWQTSGVQGESAFDEDSFSFSQRDEDQQIARAETQRDFDARVEREREGKDFDDAPGRRWRK